MNRSFTSLGRLVGMLAVVGAVAALTAGSAFADPPNHPRYSITQAKAGLAPEPEIISGIVPPDVRDHRLVTRRRRADDDEPTKSVTDALKGRLSGSASWEYGQPYLETPVGTIGVAVSGRQPDGALTESAGVPADEGGLSLSVSRRVDDLLLHIEGLVRVRELLRRRGASVAEIDEHTAEIESLRAELAQLVMEFAP